MVRYFLTSVFFASIFSVLPCLIESSLLTRPEPWIAFIGGFCLIYFQPPISCIPTSSSMKSNVDKTSANVFLITSYVILGASIFFFIKYTPESGTKSYYTGLIIGLSLIFSGMIFRKWSISTLGRFFSSRVEIQNHHKIITNGPYKYIRHPSYLGSILVLTAPPVLYQQWYFAGFAFLCFVFAYSHRINIEEKVLLQTFPIEYSNYSKKVKKLIPWVF